MSNSEPKHTQGPWEMSEPFDASTGGKAVSITGVHTDFYDGVAFNTEQEQADARLIAAAPDLLHALEMVRDAAYDQIYDGKRPVPATPLSVIERAIFKATGK